MKKTLLAILFITCLTFTMYSQELNCNVQVNSDQIQTTNKQIFTSLQKAVSEFINNRRWSDMTIMPAEKINCNMAIIINKMTGDDKFEGEIQIQSTRPVYKTGYNTTVFNFRDTKFNFTYSEFTKLELVENTFDSNLTAVLAYYAYIILGYDADTFSRLGGTPYFRKAEEICNMAQSTSEDGWKAFEKKSDRNRYSLISALMNDNYKKLREFFYEYHRWGLDQMSTNVEKGRDIINTGFTTLRDMNRQYPSNLINNIFLEAKTDEIVNIFKKGTEKEKENIYNILMDVNPTSSDKYEVIKSQ